MEITEETVGGRVDRLVMRKDELGMQSYDLVGDYYLSMAPISDGDYVLYEDAKAEIERLCAAQSNNK